MAFSPSKIVAGLTLAAMLTTLGVLGSEVVVGLWSPPHLEYESGLGTGFSFAPPTDVPIPPLTPPESIHPPDLTPAEVEARNRSIRAVLATPIDLDFPEGITFNDLLEHVKKATAKGGEAGIPIYIEPNVPDGNPDEFRSTLVSRGKPLGAALKTYLGIMGLGFAVHDGFLRIDTQAAAADFRMESIEARLDRLINVLESREGVTPH